MNDIFERRVRAAAVSAWWTLLIAVGLVSLQWVLYLIVMSTRPPWLLPLEGPNADWSFVQTGWVWVTVGFKVIIWLLGLVAVWLTLWARRLRTMTPE